MKLKLMLLVSLIAFGFAMSATAGSVTDTDSDGVPQAFDNCAVIANGPSLGGCSSQENADLDAFGDSCDGDYNNDTFVDINDYGVFFPDFVAGSSSVGSDMNCDTFVDINDFGIFFPLFVAGVPGP